MSTKNVGSQFLSLRQSIFDKALSRVSASLKSPMFADISPRSNMVLQIHFDCPRRIGGDVSAVVRNNVQIIGTGAAAMMFAHGFGCDQICGGTWRRRSRTVHLSREGELIEKFLGRSTTGNVKPNRHRRLSCPAPAGHKVLTASLLLAGSPAFGARY